MTPPPLERMLRKEQWICSQQRVLDWSRLSAFIRAFYRDLDGFISCCRQNTNIIGRSGRSSCSVSLLCHWSLETIPCKLFVTTYSWYRKFNLVQLIFGRWYKCSICADKLPILKKKYWSKNYSEIGGSQKFFRDSTKFSNNQNNEENQ